MLYLNFNKEPEQPLSVNNTYTFMQSSQLDHLSSMHWTCKYNKDGKLTFDHIEGNLDAHLHHPVYGHLLSGFEDLEDKSVLDYGCGRGRNILAFHAKVKHITGVDICQRVVELGNEYINSHSDANNFVLLKSNGIDLKFISDNSYDLVISSRCLSEIAVYSIRYKLFEEFYRVLKPGGWLSFQMTYGKANHGFNYQLSYYKNLWRASGLKYRCLVDDIGYLEKDLTTFIDFGKMSYKIVDAPEDICKDARWIFVKIQKKG